ncbi:MAG: dTDP-glucose 4,6-dehydratase [Bacteroidota bacterium]|nr:dTDP-glucose 4,6-dehydratase [Bacteroidota bacterium]
MKTEKVILVTGGAGFIGSNFIPYYLERHPQTAIVNLDLLTYAGNLDNLKEVEDHPNYQFIHGDIRNRALIEELFERYQFQGVVHFAAESHVDNSIKNPGVFIETNVNGTYNVVDVAYRFWFDEPFQVKKAFENARFHHISTDEVYGSLGETGKFTEETPYAPNSPYSASKASSDMIVRSYHHTFGLNTVITNCSNNYGPHQHDEKLIPTIIRKALAGEEIPIYGDGKNIRDWLYVLDHCEAIDRVFSNGNAGETYNVGGDCEKSNIELANLICSLLDELKPKKDGSYSDQISFVKDRAGHDRRYAIDSSKIKKQLQWKPKKDMEATLQNYLRNLLLMFN